MSKTKSYTIILESWNTSTTMPAELDKRDFELLKMIENNTKNAMVSLTIVERKSTNETN